MQQVNCRCAINKIKFPVGRDDSWEISAQLHHGSYIRFGCIEFIFAVVNYPCPPEDRIYHNLKSMEVNKTSAFTTDLCVNNQDDLSFKLRSLLNVLSSKMSSDSSPELSNCSSSRSSSCSDISILVPDHPDGIRLEI